MNLKRRTLLNYIPSTENMKLRKRERTGGKISSPGTVTGQPGSSTIRAIDRVPIRRGEIQKYCQAVAREFRPEKVILFGSQAYGHPNSDSDVDLMVVLSFRGNDVTKAIQIRSRFDTPFPLDLLVRKPGFIANRLRERDMFIEFIMTHGVVMYEGEHA
jgi:predicted nucleotidyltransferase